MNEAFNRLPIDVDVRETAEFLADCDLWGKNPERGGKGSPHEQMEDIWVRFNEPAPFRRSGDWSQFGEPHESKWLEEVPNVRDIAYDLMKFVDGGKLGGVLITKLPAGGKILPHTDSGWHAGFYEKYYIPIQNGIGSKFCFECGEIEPEAGEVYRFRNDVLHWVDNDSDEDRIAMIICIR